MMASLVVRPRQVLASEPAFDRTGFAAGAAGLLASAPMRYPACAEALWTCSRSDVYTMPENHLLFSVS